MRFFKKSGALKVLCLVLLLGGLAALCLRLRAANILAHDAAPTSARMSGFPKVFLWAWERPEDLEFINPREIGVAFLAQTIHLRDDKVSKRPRLQPLKVPSGTTLIAVVRIESARNAPPVLSNQQRIEVVEALAQIARQPNIAALQIDFDATQSERNFYQDILRDLRPRMPVAMPLSITALASWCIFDNWIDGLPVDEAVPMLFSMGLDKHRIRNYFQAGGELRASLCRQSLGISTDERIAKLSSSARLYIFNSQPWTETTVNHALERSRNEISIP